MSLARFSGCDTGNGRSNRALTTLKIDVVALMPTASSIAAVAVNTGLFASRRAPKRRSRKNSDTDFRIQKPRRTCYQNLNRTDTSTDLAPPA